VTRSGRFGRMLMTCVAIGVLAAGCSVVNKVKTAVHTVESNRTTVDSFTQNLQANASSPFAATYSTTGSTPATVVYAVDPAHGGLAFHSTQTGANASNVQVIANSSGEYACNQSGSGPWSCQKLGQADAANENKLFEVYMFCPTRLLTRLVGGPPMAVWCR
jgi:hypothetical protein